MNKKYAVINIGSLKTKCLVGFFNENNIFSPLYQSNNLTCLGCGMYENENQILEKHLQETIEEIIRLKQITSKHQCSKTKLFATHALRNAANKEYVKGRIEEATRLKVEIIEPRQEGELYFQAVINDFALPEQDYIVTDIGGGSVQVLIGNKEKLWENHSFKTGAQILHEKFTNNPHDPESITTKENMQQMKDYLAEQYSIFKNKLGIPLIYGSSNIIDLFKVIKIPLSPYKDSWTHPYKVHVEDLKKFINNIIQFPFGKREEMYQFQEGYMWGIDKAFLNIIMLCEKFGSPYIIPSNASIIQGFLCKMAKEENRK